MQTATKHEWADFLRLFVERAEDMPTRLGVFVDEPRGIQDYWVEDGLALAGIAVETGTDGPDIEMMFRPRNNGLGNHFTRSVRGVRSVNIKLAPDHMDDALEVRDREGQTTVLRFEKLLV